MLEIEMKKNCTRGLFLDSCECTCGYANENGCKFVWPRIKDLQALPSVTGPNYVFTCSLSLTRCEIHYKLFRLNAADQSKSVGKFDNFSFWLQPIYIREVQRSTKYPLNIVEMSCIQEMIYAYLKKQTHVDYLNLNINVLLI